MLLVINNCFRLQTINLDNFDYIESSDIGYAPGFEVRAVRKEMAGNPKVCIIIIKSYATKEEADAFYRQLQQAWINGDRVFVVE